MTYAGNGADLPLIVSSTVPGPESKKWSARLQAVESPDTTFLGDTFPIFWKSGKGCLVYDDDGNRFLDLTSSFGVLGLGHCHPDVQAAIDQQSKLLVHGMGDVHPSTIKVQLLEKIVEHSPIPNSQVILGLNGSDAVEAALKTALLATGKAGVIAFNGAYHGLTYGALETTARSYFRQPFEAQRGRFCTHLNFGCTPLEIETAIVSSPQPIGALIVEPIQGRGGVVQPPPGWLRQIREICTSKQILLILDEIFTGWGRTGNWFACEYEEVVPDLLCIGKTMGGGMPISACVGSRDLLLDAWGKSYGEARHTYTFLGHPLSCASALATIAVLERDDLICRSEFLGKTLMRSLKELVDRLPDVLKSVRGRGLMIGLEFHDPSQVWPTVLAALQKGLIVLPAGDNGSVIEIVPPFIISEHQIEVAMTTLDLVLNALD